MLVNAITVWKDVYEKFRECAHIARYRFAIPLNYEPTIDKSKIQLAVFNYNEIVGYIEFTVTEDYISNVYCIAFENDRYVSLKLIRKIRELFDVYNYKKVCFEVVCDNPAINRIEHIIEYFCGGYVGYNTNSKRIGGKMHTVALFEITRDEYINGRK